MPSQGDVVAKMIAGLGITEPDLDTSVGAVSRKILDVVGEAIAENSVDQHLLAYQYDIDSKVEGDLDDFVLLFGMQRLAPKRATGTVTFYRGGGDAQREVVLPSNLQVASDTSTTVFVQTVTPGYIPAGVVSIDVPVQAVSPGPAGNLGAGSLTRLTSPVMGVLSVTNVNPLSGGTTAETDSELRARWKRTVFRSLAGTEPMYEGIALNDIDCSAVNVVGATKQYREQVQIYRDVDGTLVGQSSIDDVEFIYEDTVVLGPEIDSSIILLRDHDYFFDTTVRPPRIVMATDNVDTGSYDTDGYSITESVEGMVMDLVFEYAPRDSRNLPNQSITNRVDLWVNGVRPEEAVQTVVFQVNKQFMYSTASPYFYRKFVRKDLTNPLADNVFIPLAFGPILTLPNSLTFGGKTYYQNQDFWLVHDDTPWGYTATSRFGLEWNRENLPGVNTAFAVGGGRLSDAQDGGLYTFNAVPRDVQQGVDRWRLVGIDAKVHQAKLQGLRFNIAVMYDGRSTPEVVNQAINEALSKYVSSLGFDATVQVSDALHAIHGAQGVDNVRFLEGADWLTYDPGSPNEYGVGIQRVVDGVVVQSYVDADTGRAHDVVFGDSELPVFESIRGTRMDPATGKIPAGIPSVRAQNTFYPRPALAEHHVPGAGTSSTSTTTSAPVIANNDGDPDFTLTGNLDGTSLTLDWTYQAAMAGYEVFKDDVRVAGLGPANGTPPAESYTVTVMPGVHTYQIKGYVQYDGTSGAVTNITKSNSLKVTVVA